MPTARVTPAVNVKIMPVTPCKPNLTSLTNYVRRAPNLTLGAAQLSYTCMMPTMHCPRSLRKSKENGKLRRVLSGKIVVMDYWLSSPQRPSRLSDTIETLITKLLAPTCLVQGTGSST